MSAFLDTYLLGLMGIAGISVGIWKLYRFFICRDFPSVDGFLISKAVGSRPTGEGEFFCPVVSYIYYVDGQEFTSKRYCSIADYSPTKRSAHIAIDSLEDVDWVCVFYNPKNPKFAFLRNGPRSVIVGWIFISSTMILFAALT